MWSNIVMKGKKRYSKETLIKALNDITQNKVAINEAARIYNIPRSTLGGIVRKRLQKKSLKKKIKLIKFKD